MAASPGHCVPDRSESSMLFTCAASDVFWTSPGRTRSQTTLSWKETYVLARPLRVHGRRTDPQRPPLWRTRAGKTSHRQTTAAIQRCVQEGPKSLEHRPEQLGSNNPQTVSLETDCAERSLELRRDTRSAAQGKENEKKGCSPCRQASVRLRLCPLPQGLSFPHWTG